MSCTTALGALLTFKLRLSGSKSANVRLELHQWPLKGVGLMTELRFMTGMRLWRPGGRSPSSLIISLGAAGHRWTGNGRPYLCQYGDEI
ncbi:hypothetical protein F5Y14DRAFT_430915 [Nemania sp. NC0429]|nr:hypothetical protein F5Y14DRAFT_430915 [Nemania sp. NC0429]